MNALQHLEDLAMSACLAIGKSGREAPRPVKKLLILGYAAIGDLIFFLPVIEALRKQYSDAKFTFLANSSPVTSELLPATGLIDEFWLLDWEGPKAADKKETNARIKRAEFDAVVLTLASPAHFFQAGISDIPLRVGHTRPFEPGGLANLKLTLRRALVTGEFARRAVLNAPVAIGRPSEYAVTRNLRLLEAFGIPAPEAAPKPKLITEERKQWARQQLSALDKRTQVGVHLGPVTNQYHKIWDHERFGRLCGKLEKSAELVVVGSAGEEGALEAARKHSALPHSWIGKASLLETFALISQCRLFISNDTGLAKAAMAMGVPTATIWGPSDPWEVGAPWDLEQHLDIRTGISCSPCVRLGMAKEGGLNYFNCGHHDCLAQLEVDFVYGLLERKYSAILGRTP